MSTVSPVYLDQARLADYTSFRLGGPCRRMYFCKTPEGAQEVIRNRPPDHRPLLFMGSGTNLLVSDEGVEADLLRYEADRGAIQLQDDLLVLNAAVPLDYAAEWLAHQGRGALNYCSGIPGTVGGAIVGNAGAWGKQVGDVVEWVDVLTRKGDIRRRSGDSLDFSYRDSNLKAGDELVVRAGILTQPRNAEELQEERQSILQTRAEKHPDWKVTPCIGSIFRNIEPSSRVGRRQAAGWFLEKAGAKNLSVGGARIFDRHANIIIAQEECTATDVSMLIDEMSDAVHNEFHMNLYREIRLLGGFAGHPGPQPPDFH